MTDRLAFREAMARLGAAVNVVTTDGPAGRHGVTVSAVCSVTDAPPTLIVCINMTSRSLPIFLANGVLCVNTLAGRHQSLSVRFADKALDAPARFGDATSWRVLNTGAPVLRDAPVALDCVIVSQQVVGSHVVLLCEIADIQLGEQHEALIYFGRAYHPLSP